MTEPLTIKVDGTWTVLPYGQPVTNGDGIQASYETVMLWSVEEQEAFGVFHPEPAPAPPAGKVEASRTLKDVKGRPVWNVAYSDPPQPSLDEAKAAKIAAVEVERDTRMGAGYTPTSGPLADHTLQTREDDRPNWLALAQVASVMVAQGQATASIGAIRTADNANIPVTAAEVLAAMLAMQKHLADVLGRSWTLKDAVRTAEDAAAVDAVDVSEGWPD